MLIGTRRSVLSRPAAAGNGLLNALIAYWPGDEANGDLLDAHTNGLHLTDVNTVTSAAGLVYPTARQYTRANGEYHRRPGDDALLSLGGHIDACWATWVRLDGYGVTTPTLSFIINKRESSDGSTTEYQLMESDRKFKLTMYGGGIATTLTGPDIALNTWYLVIAWHDPVADTINMQVNNGAVSSVAHAGGTIDTAGIFTIGRALWSGGGYYFDGRIGPTAFWKSAPGGGGVLTVAQRAALYNAGAGLKYAEFTT